MNVCRNCGGNDLQDLGFIGKLAPFFLKRVFGALLGVDRSINSRKRALQKIAAIPQTWFNRINRPVALVEMQLCRQCSFFQTRLPFEESAITRLYLDYRDESYNRERIEYEPTYAGIAADVGQIPVEIETRVTAATRFLQPHVPTGADFTILDYGGADGKFLPRLDGQKFVFEISNIPPIAGVTRVHSQAEMGTYSLVQLTHVIEHVVQPLDLVRQVTAHVAPGGYLYLETPQEISDERRAAFFAGKDVQTISIHEHINSYCPNAVAKLIENAGLSLVAIEASPVDVGWGKAVHIRALGRKRALDGK
jgi:hypothetical protein